MLHAIITVIPLIINMQDMCVEPYDLKHTTGKVHGEVTHFDVGRIPFKDKAGHHLWLRPEVIPAFIDMVEQANKDGFLIKLNSAHRTPEHQYRLWVRMPDIAGHPNRGGDRTHQTGYSIDISGTLKIFTNKNIKRWEKRYNRKMNVAHCDKRTWGYKCPTVLYWWLKKNAKRFGFENDVAGERWHWTYTKGQ